MIKNHSKIIVIAIFAVSSCYLSAITYYVSPTGSSTGNGTISSPYDFTTGNGKVLTGGDSLIVRGGTYNFSTRQNLTKSGSVGKYIQIVAYQAEVPVFDFRKQAYSSSNQGVLLSGSYVHLKGITIQGRR